MPYQINSSKLFLTWPQCPLMKERVLEILNSKFKIQHYVVAHELHKNGDHHIHAYLQLEEEYRTKDPKFADLEGTYHGNYQGCRSPKRVLEYCTKDEDYISDLDVPMLLARRDPQKKKIFGDLLCGKRTLTQIIEDEPQYLQGYVRLKTDYLTFLKDKEASKAELPRFLPNPWGKVLSTNLRRKKRHYWIYSDKPNLGKTTQFAKPIVNDYRASLRTGSEPYFNLRGDERLIIFDEYNVAHYRYDQLNSMCDGTFFYRIIYVGLICLPDPIVIILSNRSLRDIYPNKYELLEARFRVIKLD